MYELEYLYEQLKTQRIEYQFNDNNHDSILETVQLIEEASKNNLLSFFNKLKADFSKSEKVLEKYKQDASNCDPDGLVYKDYKVFISDSDIKKMYQDALKYVNSFNIDKLSEEELNKFIKDTDKAHLVALGKCFGSKDGLHLNMKKTVVKSEADKELSKNDINEAIKFIENSKNIINSYIKTIGDLDEEFSKNVGAKPDKSLSKEEKLRFSGKANKDYLKYMADEYYYSMLLAKVKEQNKQAKHIVVKAANFNPENLEESIMYQDYLDTMNDFEEM